MAIMELLAQRRQAPACLLGQYAAHHILGADSTGAVFVVVVVIDSRGDDGVIT